MRITYQVGADSRHDQGKGASRRLRRAGKVPAVLYGGEGGPRNITLDHQQLLTLIDKEKFYSSIISVNVDAQPQPAIVRDVQMHPARNAVVHVDLQRVVENEKLKIHLPIHFKGEAVAPGRQDPGRHRLAPDAGRGDQLPAGGSAGIPRARSVGHESQRDAVALADIPLPAGVTIPELAHRNPPVVSVHSPRAAEPEPEAVAAATDVRLRAAAAAAPAAGADAAQEGRAEEGRGQEGSRAGKKEGGKK